MMASILTWRGVSVAAAVSVAVMAVDNVALPDAASRGDLSAVRALLAARADVNTAAGDGMTALHWAAERGDVAMTTVLLRAGAKTTPVTRNGSYTPLHVAAKAGQGAVVKALLAAGADAKALTGTGATALHLAAQAGDAAAIAALLAKKAEVNAREAGWGQTPLMFAAAANRPAAVTALLKGAADPSIRTKAIDLTEETSRQQAAARKRNEVIFSLLPKAVQDSIRGVAEKAFKASQDMALQALQARRTAAGTTAGGTATAAGGTATTVGATATTVVGTSPTVVSSSPTVVGSPATAAAVPSTAPRPFEFKVGLGQLPTQYLTPAQLQQAVLAGRAMYDTKQKVNGAVETVIPADTTNGFFAGYEATVGSLGGLTAIHHAVRQGNLEATMALLAGGADINAVTATDSISPVLMATINGHFDLALALVQQGANVKLQSIHGLTPLYAAINTTWHPRSRYPQPQAIQVQQATHYELMDAILKAGADPNVRLRKNLWFFGYSNCGNANCGLEALEGTTAFWRATYAVDLEALKRLKAAGAIDTIPSYKPPVAGRRPRGGGGGFGDGLPAQAFDRQLDSAAKAVPPGIGVYPIHAAAGVGYGNGFAGNAHRHAPEGWMPTMKYLVEELHHDVNQRDLNGYNAIHHAAARGDNEMILYLVSKGADPKAVGRDGRTTVDLANGPVQRLRPFPETIALLEKMGAKNNHRCVGC